MAPNKNHLPCGCARWAGRRHQILPSSIQHSTPALTEWLRMLQRYPKFLNSKTSITAWLYLTWDYLCPWWKNNISWGWFTLLLPLTQHRVEDDWATSSLSAACDAVSWCAQAAELQSQVFSACTETYLNVIWFFCSFSHTRGAPTVSIADGWALLSCPHLTLILFLQPWENLPVKMGKCIYQRHYFHRHWPSYSK